MSAHPETDQSNVLGGHHPGTTAMRADPHAALAEILRRGAIIIAGERLVGGPRAVAFDLAGLAAKALGMELHSADGTQKTWQPPEERVQRRRAGR